MISPFYVCCLVSRSRTCAAVPMDELSRLTSGLGCRRPSLANQGGASLRSFRSHLLSVKLDPAAINSLDRNRLKIDSFETPDVNRPTVERFHSLRHFLRRWVARASKRENAADRTEVVLCSSRTPLIEHEIVPRRKQAQILFRHPMIQRSSPAANRTITHSHMVDFRIHLKTDPPAMTRASVCLHET